MRLMRYNAKAEYSPGKSLVIADALSRSPLAPQVHRSSTEDDVKAHVDLVVSNLPVSPGRRNELQASTRDDSTLQAAIHCTITGWRRYEQDIPDNLKRLSNVRNLLPTSNALLMYESRIVVPASMRADMLDRIHRGHQGITKCLERVRVSVWWPEITRYVKRVVGAYKHCQMYRPSRQKEPLMMTPLPSQPFGKVAIDLCLH